jgi:uncharacterized membrane protein YeiB
VGVDVARALAIIGMVMVHVGPTAAEGAAGRIYALPHGRASLLFVLVAGVGVSLLASSRTTGPFRFRATLLWRAALLLPVGLALQRLDHGASVILQTYAVLFVVAMVAETLPDRWLLTSAGVASLIGPGVFLVGTTRWPETFDRGPVAWGDPLHEMLHELLLSGPYPLVVWSAPLLLGMWIGRRDLRSRELGIRLVTVGTAVALGSVAVSAVTTIVLGGPDAPGWRQLVTSMTPHSQMPLWLINGLGTAIAVLGGSLLLTRVVTRAARPLIDAGQLALTIYVGHLVVLHLFPDRATADEVGPAIWRVMVATAVMLAFAHAWRSFFSRGPLESLLRLPVRAA